MESISSPLAAWKTAAANAFADLAGSLPSILAAILIVIAGWVLARVVRKAANRLSDVTQRLLNRMLRDGSVTGSRFSQPLITVVGEIAFWSVLLFAVIAAARVAGLQSVTSWLNELVIYLPNFIVGFAIIIAGYLTSVYLRERVGAAARRHAIEPGDAIGRFAQSFVFAVTLIVGLDQMGIDVVILIVAFAVIGGGLLTGLMVAFALGAREHVSNLIGARHARSILKPGLRVRIAGVEGEILEVSATHISIDAIEGRLLLPARLADTTEMLIVTKHSEHESSHGKT